MVENITNYSNLKILHKVSKKRSSQTIIFLEDRNDNWFIHVKTYKTKTGEIIDTSMIIKPDFDTWKSYLMSLGYEIKN